MPQSIDESAIVPDECSSRRLDAVAHELFPEYSRSRIQTWIKSGELQLNESSSKAKVKVVSGDRLRLVATIVDAGEWISEEIPLDICYEDEDVLVLNKPAGIIVHPAAGVYSGTLLNGLLHYCPQLSKVPRAGIVHRLDKDTTGLMVVAKNISAQTSLVDQLQERSVSRYYQAIVHGFTELEDTIETYYGRHPNHRTKMAVLQSEGKIAITHYERIASHHLGISHIDVKLQTGRTHQIRVHMAHKGHPLIGDATYGMAIPKQRLQAYPILANVDNFHRQALHAYRLEFNHPVNGKRIQSEVPLPQDMLDLLSSLDRSL